MKLKSDCSKQKTNIEVRKTSFLISNIFIFIFLILVIFAEKRAKIQKELNEIEERFKLECQEEQVTIKTEDEENGEKLSSKDEADEEMETNNNSQNNRKTASPENISTFADAEAKDENADQMMEL